MINKKGISPLIAATLLILIAIALFVAIFFWIKSLQKESIMKFGSDIRQSCLNVEFDVTYNSGILQIQNNGNIALWKLEVFKKSEGTLTKVDYISGPISPGESGSLTISGSQCEQIRVIPYLLGISAKSGIEKEYKCDEKTKIITC